MSHATPASPGEQRNSPGLSSILADIEASSEDLRACDARWRQKMVERDAASLQEIIERNGLCNVVSLLYQIAGDKALLPIEGADDWAKAAKFLDAATLTLDLTYSDEPC